jgi:hypothetical protein
MAVQLSRQRVIRQMPQQRMLQWSSRKCRSHLQQQQMTERSLLPTRERVQLLRRQEQRAKS